MSDRSGSRKLSCREYFGCLNELFSICETDKDLPFLEYWILNFISSETEKNIVNFQNKLRLLPKLKKKSTKKQGTL